MMYFCGIVHRARRWHHAQPQIARVHSHLNALSTTVIAETQAPSSNLDSTDHRKHWDDVISNSSMSFSQSPESKFRDTAQIAQLNTEASRRCAKSGRKYLHSPRTYEDDFDGFPLAFNAFCAHRWKTMKQEWMSGPLVRKCERINMTLSHQIWIP